MWDSLELFGSYLVRVNWNGWARLQSGEGRMVIDLIVWTQYINVTANTDSHVATANAALTHCVGRQKFTDVHVSLS